MKGTKSEKDDGEQKEEKNDKRQKWSEMTVVNKKLKVKIKLYKDDGGKAPFIPSLSTT
jgi:hypothetical protein